jgi:acetyltransferase-like isoleucine patch superfamily enzyme
MNKNKVFFFLQAVLRYFPFKLGIVLRRLLYPFFFKSFGEDVTIYDAVIIKYPDEIEIGNHVTINQFCYLVGKEGLKIGDDVMIGAGSKIVTSSHGFENTDKPMRLQSITFKSVTLENDIWLGFDVVITSGTYLKTGCIVGAKSLVLGKEYEAYSVLGGIPANIIKKRK